MNKLYSLCQRYYQVAQTASDWLEDAQEFLQLSQNGLDMENSEESLRNHTEFFGTEKQFQGHLEELQTLVSDMEPFIQNQAREELIQSIEALQEKGMQSNEEAQTQKELLERYLYLTQVVRQRDVLSCLVTFTYYLLVESAVES